MLSMDERVLVGCRSKTIESADIISRLIVAKESNIDEIWRAVATSVVGGSLGQAGTVYAKVNTRLSHALRDEDVS